jgi:cysteine desulfurase
VLSSKADEVILHSFEHPCLLATFQQHEERHQGTVKILSPTPSGDIDVEAVLRAITPRTKLISLMCANNETGVLYPVKQLTEAVKSVSSRILVHCDAAQLLGKGNLSFGELGVDAMTLSSHKIGALPGVGALIVKKGVHLQPMLVGGSQEMKLRGGTENVPGIFVFSEVIKKVLQSLPLRIESMKKARDAFERELQKSCPNATINFESSSRLPNTSNVLVRGMRGDDLVVALDLVHVLASTGAACSSGKREPSHVLLAHGFSESVASSSVRFSFRGDALPEEGVEVARRFSQIIDRFAKGSEAA